MKNAIPSGPSSVPGKKRPAAAPPAPADPVQASLCSRVRQLRQKKGWTLEELAAASGVSRSMLSEIERGNANPTLAVAFRIAQAFSMSLGELVETPAASFQVDVIRAQDRAFHYRSDNDCSIRTLSPLHLEKAVEFYQIVLRPGGALVSSAHFEGARELLTLHSGAVRVTSGGDSALLRKGDSAHYRADVPHSIQNTSAAEAVCYLVVTYVK